MTCRLVDEPKWLETIGSYSHLYSSKLHRLANRTLIKRNQARIYTINSMIEWDADL